jgi:hypothetical protein
MTSGADRAKGVRSLGDSRCRDRVSSAAASTLGSVFGRTKHAHEKSESLRG